MSDSLTTGYNVGECPLIQYSAAIIYKIVGFNDYWYRLITTFFYFMGILALFKICKLLLVDLFWSFTISLLFFACPNLVFYGNNFITDVPAFSLSLLGWLYFFKFYFYKNQKHLAISVLFILVASLLKATAGMNMMVIVLIFIFEKFHIVKFNKIIFNNIRLLVFLIIGFFVITFIWYLYAKHYNQVHQKTDYFLLGIWPIWSLAKEDILDVINGISNWYKVYFHVSVLYLLLILFFLILVFIKKVDRLLISITIWLFIGTCLFVVSWFFVFKDHDYYIINLYVLPVFVIITFFEFLKRHYGRIFNSLVIKLICLVFLLFNIYYTKGIIYERYNEYPKISTNYVQFENALEYLKVLDIGKENKVIVHFDCSPNYCLYNLKMQGWTDYNGKMDSAKIYEYISHGAKYLILCQKEDVDNINFRSYVNNKVGQFEDVSIYRLDNIVPQFYPLGYNLVLSCDAEKFSPNSSNLLTQPNNIKLLDGVQLSKERIHSGKNSVLLDDKFQYGFTYLMNVLPGEHYYVSVWQNPLRNSIGGVIVIEDTIGNPFRIEGKTISKNDSGGWELLDLYFKIPDDYCSNVVNVYVWNANKVPFLIDDYKIMKTKVK